MAGRLRQKIPKSHNTFSPPSPTREPQNLARAPFFASVDRLSLVVYREDMHKSSYRQLEVWQIAIDLVELTYRITASFPDIERFGLTSQMRRAAVSIPSNIAEGAGRQGRKEFLNHLSIAKGSLCELETQLTIAVRLEFTAREEAVPMWDLCQRVGQMLTKLSNSLKPE